jgi:hypothetical protein
MRPRFPAIALVLLIVSIPAVLSAQYYGPPGGSRFEMEDIRSVLLDGFENEDNNWQVSASRFTHEDFPQLKMGIEGAPIALSGAVTGAEENRYILGIRSAFTRKGYNQVWIYPEEEIVLPGEVQKLDVWVWGANYSYELEVHLRDYRGIVHKLSLGSLAFIGWRNLSVVIPNSIPQYIRYLPMERPLTLVRLVIWTTPTERVDDFICYFDHLKILTDMFRDRFDGDRLADESREIWGMASE